MAAAAAAVGGVWWVVVRACVLYMLWRGIANSFCRPGPPMCAMATAGVLDMRPSIKIKWPYDLNEVYYLDDHQAAPRSEWPFIITVLLLLYYMNVFNERPSGTLRNEWPVIIIAIIMNLWMTTVRVVLWYRRRHHGLVGSRRCLDLGGKAG